jgi:hypothetical protein
MFEKLLAKQHIRDLDLSPVRASLVQKLDWTPEKTLRVEAEYKQFLYALAHKGKDDIISPPTQDVDEFWHQHILNTRKYREDCQKIFGHYVDHTPGLSAQQQSLADACRLRVYEDYGINTLFLDSDIAPQTSRHKHSDSDGGFAGCASGGDSSSRHDSHGSHHSVGSHSGDSHSGSSGDHGSHSSSGDSLGDAGADSGSADGGGSDGGGCSGSCGGGCGGG